MHTDTLASSRLFGLIGESARLLPENAVASLELMLSLQEAAPANEAIPCPAAIARREPCVGLGYQERDALSAILEILHSAQQEENEGFGESLDGRLVEGLIVAGRLIVEHGDDGVAGVGRRAA